MPAPSPLTKSIKDKNEGDPAPKTDFALFLGKSTSSLLIRVKLGISFKMHIFWLANLSLHVLLCGCLSFLLHWNATLQCLPWDFIPAPPCPNNSRQTHSRFLFLTMVSTQPYCNTKNLGWEALFKRFKEEICQLSEERIPWPRRRKAKMCF